MTKTKEKKLEAFNKINKDDKLFINLDGFYDYKNFISPFTWQAMKSVIKEVCKMVKKGDNDITAGIYGLTVVYNRYPKAFPNIQDINAISETEYFELVKRLSVYFI